MTFLRIILLLTTSFFINVTSDCQVLQLSRKFNKPDYCSRASASPKNLMGRHVKIYHEGGVYPTLNLNKNLKWPSRAVRQRSGISGWGTFRPKAGDTGVIVHLFRRSGKVNRYTYLLKVGDYYVPIACSYLTDYDMPDSHEQAQQLWINDSIENVAYAAGCKFKIKNDNWSRAGLMKIDKQSEGFACELVSRGIDTVMLCKYISDNGSIPAEKAFVLWLDKGNGFVKSFFNNSKHEPTETSIAPFNLQGLITYFFENRLDTLTSKPTAKFEVSHSLGYSVQVYTSQLFYRERLTDFIIHEDKSHLKAIWWNMISYKLASLKP